MQVIKILDIRLDNKGYKRRWAVFFCFFCLQEVEKQLSVGKKQKSCGCQIHNYKHGETGGRLYLIWMNMKQRCYNINNTEFINYGGRDITICPEWANDYTKFRDWAVKNGYVDSLTIDRINNDGNYEPSNCHFVTRTENNRNTRHCKINIIIANEIRSLYKTGKYTQKILSKKFNLCTKSISKIIRNKQWSNY